MLAQACFLEQCGIGNLMAGLLESPASFGALMCEAAQTLQTLAGSDAHPVRARPKSQIFRSQLALSSRLDGFKSRCSTLALWTYFNPRSSCVGGA